MPDLETPPNPPAPNLRDPHLRDPDLRDQAESQPAPLRVRTGRYGELEEHELLHLLDSLDDERSRSRFRESIYISFIIYLALAWFVFYGPKVLFHQGRIILPADVLKERDKQLTYLDLPKDLSKLPPPPKDTKTVSDQARRAQTAKPTLDRKTLEQLQAMRRAGTPGPAAPAPRPLPATPQPQPAAPAQPRPQPSAQPSAQPPAQTTPSPRPQPPAPPQPAAPTPQPRQQASAVPDAPRPSPSTRPNFSTPATAGDSIRAAADAAARGQGGNYGANAPAAHNGANTGVEVLSDTLGVDFGPYIKRILRMIYNSWVPLIPEETRPPLSKEGSTLIRFTINSNGVVSAMHLDASTHDQAIDRAAWGGIQGVGQFPPLPANFKGPNLELRIQFSITHSRNGAE